MDHKDVYVKQLMNATTMVASGTSTSASFDIGSLAQNGVYSMYLAVAAQGTSVTAIYQLSPDDKTFVTPSSASDIVTEFPNAGAGLSDLVQFAPELARFLRIQFTATTGAPVVTAFLMIQ